MDNKVGTPRVFHKCNVKSFWLAFLVTIITAIGLMHMNDRLKSANDKISMYKDSLKVTVLENGNLLYEKSILTADNQQIKNILSDKDEEIKKLKDKLLYYTEIDATIKIDSVLISDTVFVDSCRYVNTNYMSEYLTFDLSAVLCDSTANFLVSNITIPVKLNAVISKENNVYVESNNPYLKIQDITTIKQENKKIEFYHGPQVGVGAVYGIKNGFDFGFYVGYGVGIKF